ncbi:T9SS type A sorting domain-containing protein [Nonlabens sp.]|uniref:T9SS type A sorting domain-containing protein n=1 Tax=Nonlabens sp. TaxID=1888209 RepID=UPI003F6A3634
MNKNYLKRCYLFALVFCFSILSYGQIIQDGTYAIFNTVHSEVLTTETSAPYEAEMAAFTPNDDFQLWSFTHQGGDIYKIVNQGSNTTLGINDGWCGQFGDVRAGFANSDLNVEFKISAAAVMDTFVFEIAFTTCNFGSMNVPIKAFDIENGASGAQVQTFDVAPTNPNQQFQIVDPATLSIPQVDLLNEVVLSYDSLMRDVIINSNRDLSISKIEVFDLTGRLVQDKLLIQSEELKINFNGSLDGVYFVRLISDKKQIVRKVIVY